MNLTPTENHGIKGINYYFVRREKYEINLLELEMADVKDPKAYVDATLIPLLKKANEILTQYGYEIIVKDAYRSAELYGLIQQKRYAKYGKEQTDKILNTVSMPHSSGRAADIGLVQIETGEEIPMRNKEDDPDNFFIDYYRDKNDPESQEYQRLQDLLVDTMLSLGFVLGSKKEYWHFEL